MSEEAVRDSLPVDQRLALAYAPAAVRSDLLAVMALDTRLAKVTIGAREPILGQLRLAWWRDRLGEADRPPRGEPLLDFVSQRSLDPAVLTGLVDAWEALLGDPEAAALERLAAARARALVWACGAAPDDLAGLTSARAWALADLCRLPGPWNDLAADLCSGQAWEPARLPRALRAVAVLHALARSARVHGGTSGARSVLVALRVGLLGI